MRILRSIGAMTATICLMTGVATAQEAKQPDKKQAITDPAKAGPDYALQGEYQGEIDGKKMGAQVVALGDEKFDLVLYTGGLPGDGWKRGDPREKASGVAKDGAVAFKLGEAEATLKAGELALPKGKLAKTERKSPTLGAKPPEGAVVLFDGNSNDFKSGQATEEGFLAALAQGGQSSNYKFTGDFTLHLEFRTPYQPYARGQGRGNSGVYLHGRNEVQVLDSFGLEGANNECGGFYSKKAPDVNMCLPPLAWQTYDIDFIAAKKDDAGKVVPAKITVRHNGVVIHENQELGDPKTGPLNLQNHGNPVVYRNIWVVEKK